MVAVTSSVKSQALRPEREHGTGTEDGDEVQVRERSSTAFERESGFAGASGGRLHTLRRPRAKRRRAPTRARRRRLVRMMAHGEGRAPRPRTRFAHTSA